VERAGTSLRAVGDGHVQPRAVVAAEEVGEVRGGELELGAGEFHSLKVLGGSDILRVESTFYRRLPAGGGQS